MEASDNQSAIEEDSNPLFRRIWIGTQNQKFYFDLQYKVNQIFFSAAFRLMGREEHTFAALGKTPVHLVVTRQDLAPERTLFSVSYMGKAVHLEINHGTGLISPFIFQNHLTGEEMLTSEDDDKRLQLWLAVKEFGIQLTGDYPEIFSFYHGRLTPTTKRPVNLAD